MRKIWCIELNDPWSERIAAVRDDARRIGYVQHVLLAERVSLERGVKLLVELVVPGHAVPLEIVVAPGAVVDGIGADIDIVVGGVGLIAHAGGDGWPRTGI